MVEELSPQTQHMLMQLQQYQNQAQVIALQKQQLELQIAEISAALEALKDIKDKMVFKAVGPILAKVDREKTNKELTQTKELIELRIKTMDKQEERVRDKMKEINDKISKSLPPSAG